MVTDLHEYGYVFLVVIMVIATTVSKLLDQLKDIRSVSR